MKINKLIKKVIVLAIILYTSVTFIKQQKSLNAYNNEQIALNDKIQEQKEYNETLLSTKQNITSPEYIEQIAREKLGMYKASERAYVDVNN